MKKINLRASVAELIGTAILVFFGCGTACMVGCDVKGGYLATAVAFGLVIIAMAYSIGNISGCHINPAVTIAMFIHKKISVRDAIAYVISQFLGGIIGAAFLSIFFSGYSSAYGANALYNKSYFQSFLVEVILTFVFVFAILGVTSRVKSENISGIVIGSTLTLVHIIGIGFTGTSVNPARSFGPALFAGGEHLKVVWVFILAPLVGSAIAAYAWMFLKPKKSGK